MPNSTIHWLSGLTLAATCAAISATATTAQTSDSNICYFVSESGEVINLESWCGSGSGEVNTDNSFSDEFETRTPGTNSTDANEDTSPRTHSSTYGNVTDAEGNTQRVRNLQVEEREDGGVTIEYQTPVDPDEVFNNND